MAGVINLHAWARKESKYYGPQWAAIRLSDGGSDGVLYDTRADAVSHQLHEKHCCYVMIPPDGMSPQEADVYLEFNRAAYDAGWSMSDPEQPVTRITSEGLQRQHRQLIAARRKI